MKAIFQFTLAGIVTFLLGGCSPSDPTENLPAVNDKNCTDDAIGAIKNEKARKKFADMCFLRVSTAKPSAPKKW
jgi:entry exclusion lipoprotein TrbK